MGWHINIGNLESLLQQNLCLNIPTHDGVTSENTSLLPSRNKTA